jgi:hypothetical protein
MLSLRTKILVLRLIVSIRTIGLENKEEHLTPKENNCIYRKGYGTGQSIVKTICLKIIIKPRVVRHFCSTSCSRG